MDTQIDYNSSGVSRQRFGWMNWVSAVVLSLAILNFAASPLVLGTPGSLVAIYLDTVVLCLFALAIGKRWWLVILALALGIAAVVAANHDHRLGMQYAEKEGRQAVLDELKSAPSAPAQLGRAAAITTQK
jgi:hypothetical protein